MLSAIILSVKISHCIYRCAECHYAGCSYAECNYAECQYTERHYAECHYAEHRGTARLP